MRASQLTIGQFCEPLAVWAFQVIPVNIVTNSTHSVDFCLTIEMANSPQICLNRHLGKQLT